jgi:Protein of unknown function (DUF3352)
MTVKKRNYLPIIGVGIACVGIGYYASQRFLSGSELTLNEAVKLMPQQAVAIGYISTKEEDWSQLQEIGIPKDLLQKQLDRLNNELFTNSKITYEGDIQPWLGGAAIAILPPSETGAINDERTLVIFGIKNKLKAYDFFKKLETEAKEKVKKTNYQGVDILEASSSLQNVVYSALLSDRIVLSLDRSSLEASIDTQKGKSSLASDENVKKIIAQPLKVEHPLAQMYFVNYGKFLQDTMQKDKTLPISNASFDYLNSVAIGMGTKNKSLHLQTLTKFDPEKLSLDYSTSKETILSQFPDNTILFFSGNGMDKIWSNTVAQLEKIPEFNTYLNQAKAGLSMTTGIDLDKDIFGWMNGEFGVGIVPTKTAIIPQLGMGLGGALAFETNDANTAKASFAKLDKLIQQNIGLPSIQKSIDGKMMTQWREPTSNMALSYGWVKDNRLLLTIGDSVSEAIELSKQKSLDKNSKFQALVKDLPGDNLGYFYLNVEPIVGAINKLPDSEKTSIDPDALTLLNSMSGIGSTTTMSDKSSSQTDFLVRFK